MPRLTPLLLAAALALAACDRDAEPPAGPVEITVLVAYTAGAAASVGDAEAHMRRAFEETNAVYANSGVDARLVPVHRTVVEYEVEDRFVSLSHLIGTDDGVLDGLHPLRDQYEADVVVLVSATPGSTLNGSILATPETAFLIVEAEAMGAPRYEFAHEMGHLHGARHHLEDDPTLEPFPYGHAFRTDSFATVLAWGRPRKAPVFSGPGSVHEGAVLGDADRHDNARVVRETAVYISNFRGPQRPTDFVPPGTWPTLVEGRPARGGASCHN